MRNKFRTGGAIVSLLFTIASHSLFIAGVGTRLGFTVDLQWFTLGGLVVFVGIMGWWVYELSSTMPSIEVKIIDDPSGYYLEIFNSGSVGKFKAQLEILDSLDYIFPQSKQVAGHWLIGRREPEIMKGQRDKIKIATLEMPPQILLVSYRLYCDVDGREAIWANSSFWNPFTGHTGAWFIIKVTISATPELKGGVFTKTYRLDNRGLGVVKMSKRKEEKQGERGISKKMFHAILDKASQPIKKSEKGKS